MFLCELGEYFFRHALQGDGYDDVLVRIIEFSLEELWSVDEQE
jgi:hypothetical protein